MKSSVGFIVAFILCLSSLQANAQRTPTQQQTDERLAWQLYSNRDYEKAKNIYKGLYDGYGRANYLYNYIDCLLKLKDYDEAEKSLKNAIKKNGSDLRLSVDLCYVLMLKSESSKSEKTAENMIKNLPDNINSYNLAGNLFISRGMFEYALSTYENGAANTKLNYKFLNEQATALQYLGRYVETVEKYFEILNEDKNQYNTVKSKIQQLLYFDVNSSIEDDIRTLLLQKVQQHPDDEQYAELQLWFSLEEKDYETAMLQCLSLDRRFDNRETQILELASICRRNRQFNVALDGYQYISAKGRSSMYYSESLIGGHETQYEKAESENISDNQFYVALNRSIDKVLDELGANSSTRSLIAIKAKIAAYKFNDSAEAIGLFEKIMKMPLSLAEKSASKLDMADVYLYSDEVWEATLLYSQVEKSMRDDMLGHEARYRNARLRYFIGEFAWAEAQLNVLKAATSKLIANDAMMLSLLISDNLDYDTLGINLRRLSKADFLIYKGKENDALVMLDSVINSDSDETSIWYALFRKASILENSNNLSQADSVYSLISSDYPDAYFADEAIMHSAIIREKKGDVEGALKCYESIIENYPVSIHMATARKKYRQLHK